jgi:hypothetical protein
MPRRQSPPPWPCAYNLACLLAIGLPGPDHVWTTAERQACKPVFNLLRLAAEAPDNIRASEWIGHDPDLATLRGNPDFIAFLRQQIKRDFGIDHSNLPPPPGDDWFFRQVRHSGRAPTGGPPPMVTGPAGAGADSPTNLRHGGAWSCPLRAWIKRSIRTALAHHSRPSCP